MQLYLVLSDKLDDTTTAGVERFRFRDDVMLVVTGQTRSRLYHDVKKQVGRDAELLVCPVDGEPKFKNMNKGALAWLRDVRDRHL